jgi:hypothetical protein
VFSTTGADGKSLLWRDPPMPRLPKSAGRNSRNFSGRPQGSFSFDDEPIPDARLLPPDCCAIPLTNGGYVLVDEQDLCRVDEHDWYKKYDKKADVWYAYTPNKSGTSKHPIAMHRHLFGLTTLDCRIVVDHKNHNGLDNRRSCNLRIATRAQNHANSRTWKKTSSQYRGVKWNKKRNKWHVAITLTTQGVKRQYNIGYYVIEEEAAFAFHVAAPLLKDPEFLELDPFPDDKLPTPKRQTEIKAEVIARVKARRGGTKGNLDATSRFYGVSYIPRDQLWRTLLKIGSRYYYLGLYTTEIEAAYAYNCAVSIEKVMRKTNPVTEADLVSSERATSIHAEVVSRLDAAKTGKKVSLGKSSRYRGACFSKEHRKWSATITLHKKINHLGFFETEIQAAIAYNIAASILKNNRHIPNPIDQTDLPPSQIIAVIQARVERKLADSSSTLPFES